MLSNHAFNAMLKTLEEPPPDVKFLLATTDPQKIPVTVLSRCLQFNLKNVPPDTLQSHLSWVLEQETIDAERMALAWIAAAAQGSVRDALSLTDQAIAYGAGKVTETAVQSMLGLVQRELLARLLREIAEHQPVAAFAVMEELLAAGASADALLADMARWFHQAAALATLKIEPGDDPTGAIALLAQKMSPELLQLNYQIVTLGRRDLALAPDERTGLEMTLLRLFAFQPTMSGVEAPVRTASLRAPRAIASVTTKSAAPSLPSASLTPEQWPTVSRSLKVGGLAKQFMQHAQLVHCEDAGRSVNCKFRVSIPSLCSTAVVAKAQEALRDYFGKPCRIDAEVGEVASLTAAVEDAQVASEEQARAESAIHSDPAIQAILKEFGASIVPGSIRPVKK